MCWIISIHSSRATFYSPAPCSVLLEAGQDQRGFLDVQLPAGPTRKRPWQAIKRKARALSRLASPLGGWLYPCARGHSSCGRITQLPLHSSDFSLPRPQGQEWLLLFVASPRMTHHPLCFSLAPAHSFIKSFYQALPNYAGRGYH